MHLLVYPNDIVDNPTIFFDNLNIDHIKAGMAFPQVSDTVIFIDEEHDRFKVLKCENAPEFVGIIIDDLSNLKNFV